MLLLELLHDGERHVRVERGVATVALLGEEHVRWIDGACRVAALDRHWS